MISKFVKALTLSAALAATTALPAQATTAPSSGGGCNAWMVSASHSGSTISATFRLSCETYHAGEWLITGYIAQNGTNGRSKSSYHSCFSSRSHPVGSCSVTVTYTGDPAGSQSYKLGIVGLPSETHIGAGGLSCYSGIYCLPYSTTRSF